MATIAVIAATGRTGQIIVRQALDAGHTVTAIARRPLDLHHPRLTQQAADVLAGPPHLGGHDVVISALGSAGRGPTTVYSAGTAAIIAAMPPAARLIVLSSAGLAVPDGAGLGTRLIGKLLYRVMRHPYDDMARMEALLAASDLDWTAIRPTGLNDDPPTGKPRVSIGALQRVGHRTSRAQLAAYILGHLDDPATYRTAVAISS